MCVKLSPEDLNSDPYLPHSIPHKHLLLWNDHHTKGARWSAVKYYNFYL